MTAIQNIGVCLALLVAFASNALAADPPGRPNIILFLADDMGYSDVGCFGGEIPTPNIDALARSGIRFTQFYNNAVCGPTRAALLTGLYPQQVGHTGRGWNDATQFSQCMALGDVLKLAGYRTLMVGKWQERALPARHGFDRFFGPNCAGKISYFNEVTLNPFYLDQQRWHLPDDGFYLTDALTDYSLRFLEEALAKPKDGAPPAPFFLYLAHLAPHWPLHAREADIAPHRQRYRTAGWDEWRRKRFDRQRELGIIPDSWKLGPRPASVPDWKRDALSDWQAERMAVYAAQVQSLDRSLGKVMDLVRKAGALDNTIILFLSDNGAAPDGSMVPTSKDLGFDSAHPNTTWRIDGKPVRAGTGPDNLPGPADTFQAYGPAWANVSNTPFRDAKSTAYEGGIRTPLIVSWPAVIHDGGRITAEVGHVMDFLPTFADVAGVKYPAEFQGRKLLTLQGKSLLPILQGQPREGYAQICWQAPLDKAIRAGKWKLVESPKTKAWELYDLAADGTETIDLAAQFPDVVKSLSQRWEQWAER